MNAITCAGCKHAYAETALFCPNCGRPKVREAVNDALVGKLLGERFQVQELLGQGGSGTIYRAEHVTLRRKVAIKVLHDELSRDDLAVERFRREATTVAEIDNEHIVEIHDFGRTPDGRLYLAMELLEGETLDHVLAREGQLSIERSADILIQVGEALMEAHAIGYVHRDLRPRNVYLAIRRGKANFVKLLDFGLAKLVETDASAASTSLGMTFGDPRYMSPEQARGDRIDRRADIYQLGCVAYEMMTGAPPFSGNRVFDILTKQVTEAPAPLPTRRPGVPLWMEAAVAKMLAKDPENRFATTTRMVEALRRGLETGEVMEDEVARRRESIPPPSVSRVMQKMGIATEAELLPPKPVAPAAPPAPAPAAPAFKPTETRPMPAASVEPRREASQASPQPEPDARTTQRGLPPAKVPDSVELLRRRTGTPRVGVPVSMSLAAEAVPQESNDQPPVAGTIQAKPAVEPNKPEAPAQTFNKSRNVIEDDQRDDDLDDDSDAHETRLAPRSKRPTADDIHAAPSKPALREVDDDGPRAKRATGDVRARRASSSVSEPVARTKRASSAGDGPRPRRPTGPDEKGVSQAWYDEGDLASDDADTDRLRRARKTISPSATDLSFYDEVPRRRWGAIIAVLGVLLVGGIVFAMTRGGGDKPTPKTPVADNNVGTPAAIVDAAPSTVIEDAAVAEAKPPEDATTKTAKTTPGKAPATLVGDVKKTPTTPTRVGTDPTGFPSDEPRRFPGKDPDPPKKDPDPPKKDPSVNGGGPQDPYNPAPGEGATGEKKSEFFANLGSQNLANGDLVNAASNFKKALDLNANNVVAIIGQGEIALRQGAFADAIAHLTKATRFARSARVFTLLGDAYLSSGNNTAAAANFKQALQLDPDNARARDGYNEASAKVPPPTDE